MGLGGSFFLWETESSTIIGGELRGLEGHLAGGREPRSPSLSPHPEICR
jgi:hypothetical protein